jgi:hypothetical protein
MRVHTLLIAGALAGLMATAGSMHALEVKAPVAHSVNVAATGHKHLRKHGSSEKHLAITKDGRTRSAPGTVSKSLIGKSNHGMRSSGVSARRKHHVKSSNATMKHHKKNHSLKSSKKYQ